MHNVLNHMNNSKVSVYDIVIYVRSFSDLIDHMRTTLIQLLTFGLLTNVLKVRFLLLQIKLLGYIVGLQEVRPNHKEAQSLVDAIASRTKTQLRSFLGTSSFLRRFISNQASIFSFLIMRMTKGTKYEQNSERQTAFENGEAVASSTLSLEHLMETMYSSPL